MVAAVPEVSVPAETALAMAVCKVPMVSPVFAVNLNVSPVCASLMVVTEPAVSAVEAESGLAAEPFAELYAEAADMEPRTASFELTTIPAVLEFVAIES